MGIPAQFNSVTSEGKIFAKFALRTRSRVYINNKRRAKLAESGDTLERVLRETYSSLVERVAFVLKRRWSGGVQFRKVALRERVKKMVAPGVFQFQFRERERACVNSIVCRYNGFNELLKFRLFA